MSMINVAEFTSPYIKEAIIAKILNVSILIRLSLVDCTAPIKVGNAPRIIAIHKIIDTWGILRVKRKTLTIKIVRA